MTLEHGILIYGFYDSFLDNIADAVSKLAFDLHFEKLPIIWFSIHTIVLVHRSKVISNTVPLQLHSFDQQNSLE